MTAQAKPTTTGGDIRAGLLDITPILIGMAPFGLAFGTIAGQKGLSPFEVFLMSITVHAGSAQFLAVNMWSDPVAVGAIVFAALLVNLRYVMLGAALVPVIGKLPTAVRTLFLYYHSDESWALTIKRKAAAGAITPQYLAGLCLPLSAVWISTSIIGSVIGRAITDPVAYGFDFVFIALFAALACSFVTGRRSLTVVVASAIVSVLTHRYIPGSWYIFAGGLSGMITGALTRPRHAEEAYNVD